MKKRMLAFFLALVMAFGLLSGCGSKPAANGGDGNGAEDLSGISERTIRMVWPDWCSCCPAPCAPPVSC